MATTYTFLPRLLAPVVSISLSPNGKHIAVVGSDGCTHIYTLNINGSWTHTVMFTNPFPDRRLRGNVIALWHPTLPHRLTLGHPDGFIEGVCFSHHGETDIHSQFSLPRFLRVNRVRLQLLCVNDDGSEASGFFGENSVFTMGDPWEDCRRVDIYEDSVPPTFVANGGKPVGLWYIENSVILGAYPLGLISMETAFPHRKKWQMNISPARAILSGALHPDRQVFMAVTQDGNVEIYNLVLQQFAAKICHSTGPYRSVMQAIFYDRASVALVMRRPFPGLQEPRICIIKDLIVGGPSADYHLQVMRTSGAVTINRSHVVMTGGSISAKGSLVFVTDWISNVVVAQPEDLRVLDGFSLLLDMPAQIPPAALPTRNINIVVGDSDSENAWGSVADRDEERTPALSLDGEGEEGMEEASNAEAEDETPEVDGEDPAVNEVNIEGLPIVVPGPFLEVEHVDGEEADAIIEGMPFVGPTPGMEAQVRDGTGRPADEVIVAAVACYFGGVVLAAMILGGSA